MALNLDRTDRWKVIHPSTQAIDSTHGSDTDAMSAASALQESTGAVDIEIRPPSWRLSGFSATSPIANPVPHIVAPDDATESYQATINFYDANTGLPVSVTGFIISDIDVTGNALLANFAGGGSSYSVTVNPISDGIVSLRIKSATSANGAIPSLYSGETFTTVTAIVAPIAPIAQFTINIVEGHVFVDGSTSSSVDSTIVNWAWNFAGGYHSSGVTAFRDYPATGVYSITLKVTDANGLTDSIIHNVAVNLPVVKVGKILALAWNVEKLLTASKTVTCNWAIGTPINSISNALELNWNTDSKVNNSNQFNWEVTQSGKVASSLNLNWNTRQVAIKQNEFNWTVKEELQSSHNFPWIQRETISNQLQLDWALRESVNRVSTYHWDVAQSNADLPVIILSNPVITNWNGTNGDVSIDFEIQNSSEDIIEPDILYNDVNGFSIETPPDPVAIVSSGSTGTITFQYEDAQDWHVSIKGGAVTNVTLSNAASNVIFLDHTTGTASVDLVTELTGVGPIDEEWVPGNAWIEIKNESGNDVYGPLLTAPVSSFRDNDADVSVYAGTNLTYKYKLWTLGAIADFRFDIDFYDSVGTLIGGINRVVGGSLIGTVGAPTTNGPAGSTLAIPANAVTMNATLRFESPDQRADDVSITAGSGAGSTLVASVLGPIDTTPPDLTILDAPASANFMYPVIFQFEENVVNFDITKVTVGNGTISNFQGANDTYTADITPDGNGDITIDVFAGVCEDLAGNLNNAATQVVTTYITSTNFNYITVGNENTGEQEPQNGDTVNITSGDLDMPADSTSPSSHQDIGIKIDNVQIPILAGVLPTYIQFQTDEISTGTVTLTIRGELNPSPSVFTTAVNDISDRLTTNAFVTWTPADWNTVGERGIAQRTPDLSPIIQELVAAIGWNPGQSMAFIITGNGTDLNNRAAESYDSLNPSFAPELIGSYTAAETGAPIFTHQPIQNVSAPIVTGAASAGQVIKIYNGSTSTVLGTGIVQLDNTFSIQLPTFVDGTYNFEGTSEGTLGESARIPFTIKIDTVSPSVIISGAPGTVSNTNPFTISLQTSELTNDFTISDISISNGSPGNFQGSNNNYTVDIIPTGSGDLAIQVLAGSFNDTATNPNIASAITTVIYDGGIPSSAGTRVSNYVTATYIRARNGVPEALSLVGKNMLMPEISSIAVTQQPSNGTLSISLLTVTFTPNVGVFGLSENGQIRVDWINGRSDVAQIFCGSEKINTIKHYAGSATGDGSGNSSGNKASVTGLAAAVNSAGNGTLFLTDPGTYNTRLHITGAGGTVAEPLIIEGNGGLAKFHDTSAENNTVYLQKGVNRIVFKSVGIEKSNAQGTGLFSWTTGALIDVVLDECIIENCTSNGTNFAGEAERRATVINSIIRDNHANGWIGAHFSHMKFLNNDFLRNADTKDYTGGAIEWNTYMSHPVSLLYEGNLVDTGEGLMKMRGCSNFTVQKNVYKNAYISGISAGGDTQTPGFTLQNGTINRNIVQDSQQPFGLSDQDNRSGGGGIANVTVHDNAFINSATDGGFDRYWNGYLYNDGYTATNVRLTHNIFWGRTDGIGYGGCLITHSSFEFDHNLVAGGENVHSDRDRCIRTDGATPNIHDCEFYRIHGTSIVGTSLINGNTDITSGGIPQEISDIIASL